MQPLYQTEINSALNKSLSDGKLVIAVIPVVVS